MHGAPGLQSRRGVEPKQALGEGAQLGAGHAYDANAAPARRRCDRDDRLLVVRRRRAHVRNSKLCSMNRYEDPLSRIGMTLACALLAQIASVMLAALLASTVPGGYRVRAWVFLGALTWTLAGTVLLVVQTTRADQGRPPGGIRPSRIALWIVSSWLWPILVRWRRPG
jgi:hypothetical protein